jgi:hypothetical protein
LRHADKIERALGWRSALASLRDSVETAASRRTVLGLRARAVSVQRSMRTQNAGSREAMPW